VQKCSLMAFGLSRVTRVNPQYPSLARGMKLQGSVKVEAVVGPQQRRLQSKAVIHSWRRQLTMLFRNESGYRPPKKPMS
jgi:hypothetical protein